MCWRLRPAHAAAAVALVVAGGCGSPSSAPASKGAITVASFNSPESTVLAELYGQGLSHDGKGAGEATGHAAETATKLNVHIASLGLVALNPSLAAHQDTFAVTQATATKYNLAKFSDLASIGDQLVLGAGPDCPARPSCLPGLQSLYGIHFKGFKALDTDGPATRTALKDGTIQVGLVSTSDADLTQLGLVALQDDRHLENAGNVLPILRQDVASDEVKMVLDAISGKLTTADLIQMNSKVSIDHQDPAAVARAWLEQHNYSS